MFTDNNFETTYFDGSSEFNILQKCQFQKNLFRQQNFENFEKIKDMISNK